MNVAQIIDALPMPALYVTEMERVDALNGPARGVLGQGLVGRHYVTALRQPALLDAIEVVMRSGMSGDAAYLAKQASRDVHWHAHVAPLGGGVLITFLDRSDVEEAGQARRDFVANVSHELRTPLTALTGFIDTLRGAARADPIAQERFLGIMSTEAARMNRLIDDLLSLSRVEANERMRPRDTIDLTGVLRSVVSALTPMAEGAGVTLGLEMPAETVNLPGDGDQLVQVMSNLVENAIKYGGQRVEITLRIHQRMLDLRGAAAQVDVCDDGPGISTIHLPRLTQRFYRIDQHRSREIGGTGLGLAIVKHIIGRHRGRLKITSELGKGSNFTVLLPLKVDPDRETGGVS